MNFIPERKNMKKVILFIIMIMMLPVCISAQQLRLPANNAVAGWKQYEKLRLYTRNDLYGHIDGGAELFLELGFKDLLLQKYRKGESEITIEAYRMENTDSALALYLFKCGNETPLSGIPVRHTGDQYQITILKSNYFLLINNFNGDKALQPAMIAFANKTLKNIPAGTPSTIFKILPAENLIKGTEFIIRGQYSLQSFVTLGEGDILQLNGKFFGIAGDYKDTSGAIYTRIIIPYPDAKSAQSAYTNLLTHLDSYLKVVQKSKQSFSFKNTQGKVSKAWFQGQLLHISLYLK